jgi:hypothetical protein
MVAVPGGLFGSLIMWMLVGPAVIKRAAPKVVKGVLQNTMDLSDEEIAAADGSMFKAMTKKQGESFAQAVNGALGNLIQAKPDEELEALAKKYGFGGVEDAKAKILGNGVDGRLGERLAQSGVRGDPGALLGVLDTLKGDGGTNKFSGLVQTIALIQALGALGGGDGSPGVSGMQSLGSSRSSSSWKDAW